MKVVALLSGGKDSCYAILQCIRGGHDVVAVATLLPPPITVDEVDSHCFQTVGHALTPSVAACLGLPFFSRALIGTSVSTALHYEPDPRDEVEDLLALLSDVRAAHPDVTAVCSGAILSNYQRLRVEHVAGLLGWTALAPLWQREQRALLQEMVAAGMEAVLVKVASMGLDASFVGRTIGEVAGRLKDVAVRWGVNECGEGGEYESITLDCPLFRRRRVVLEDSVVVTEDGDIAPVSLLRVKRWSLQQKEEPSPIPVTRPAPPRVKVWTPVSASTAAQPAEWRKTSSSLSGLFPPIRVVRDLAFVSANPPRSSVDLTAKSSSECLSSVLSSHLATLQSKGFSPSHIVSVLLALPSMAAFSSVNAAYALHIPAQRPPSRTTIELPMPSVQADLVACSSPHATSSLHVQSVSPWAPACIGPYSQSVSCYRLLWQAGQIGLVGWTMTMDSGGEAAEVQRVRDNCEAVLDAVRSDYSAALLTIVWLATADRRVTQEVVERCRCKGAVVWLYVPALPRDAAVEVQQLAYQPSAAFVPRHRSSTRSHRAGLLHSQSSFVEETVLCLVLTVVPSAASDSSDCGFSPNAIAEAVREEVKAAALRVSDVWMVRCYYVQDAVDVGSVEKQMHDAWSTLVEGPTDMPAVSFLPVRGVAVDDGRVDGAVLSIHCLFCDSSTMPT